MKNLRLKGISKDLPKAVRDRSKFCSHPFFCSIRQVSVFLRHEIHFHRLQRGEERNVWNRVVPVESWRNNLAYGSMSGLWGLEPYVSCPSTQSSLWLMKELQDHFKAPSPVQNTCLHSWVFCLSQCLITWTFLAIHSAIHCYCLISLWGLGVR